ncbi:MAG: hypothetical protein JJT94_05960 [Bernardetiaceae bacterium]|nr:hypothetical protein [Bernardetiaceae bacterium]
MKYHIIFLLCTALALFVSCSSGNEMSNEDCIKNTKDLDSLIQRLKHIDDRLDRVAALDGDLHKDDDLAKADALEKIARIEQELQKSLNDIIDLERGLKESDSRADELGGLLAAERKKNIVAKQKEIAALKAKVNALEQENVNLKDEVAAKDQALTAKGETIDKQQQKLIELNLKIAEAEKKIQQATEAEDKANTTLMRTYFNAGKELREVADKVSGAFAGKRKCELTQQSYDYFIKSWRLGNPDAQYEVNVMKTDKKYSKCLED